MRSDYYEPHPRMRLARPVVIAGQIGCGAAAIGHHVASRTGLPVFEIDRWIEHEAGRSLARVAEEEGVSRVEGWAKSALERLLRQPRCALIVLDRAWPPPGLAQGPSLEVDFVHLKRPASLLLERLSRERRRGGDWLLGDLRWPIETESELQPMLDRREPLLARATIVLDAEERHENDLAAALLDSLGSVMGAETL